MNTLYTDDIYCDSLGMEKCDLEKCYLDSYKYCSSKSSEAFKTCKNMSTDELCEVNGCTVIETNCVDGVCDSNNTICLPQDISVPSFENKTKQCENSGVANCHLDSSCTLKSDCAGLDGMYNEECYQYNGKSPSVCEQNICMPVNTYCYPVIDESCYTNKNCPIETCMKRNHYCVPNEQYSGDATCKDISNPEDCANSSHGCTYIEGTCFATRPGQISNPIENQNNQNMIIGVSVSVVLIFFVVCTILIVLKIKNKL